MRNRMFKRLAVICLMTIASGCFCLAQKRTVTLPEFVFGAGHLRDSLALDSLLFKTRGGKYGVPERLADTVDISGMNNMKCMRFGDYYYRKVLLGGNIHFGSADTLYSFRIGKPDSGDKNITGYFYLRDMLIFISRSSDQNFVVNNGRKTTFMWKEISDLVKQDECEYVEVFCPRWVIKRNQDGSVGLSGYFREMRWADDYSDYLRFLDEISGMDDPRAFGKLSEVDVSLPAARALSDHLLPMEQPALGGPKRRHVWH